MNHKQVTRNFIHQARRKPSGSALYHIVLWTSRVQWYKNRTDGHTHFLVEKRNKRSDNPHRYTILVGLLNISGPRPIDAPGKTACISGRECSKKSVQQGRSPFDARSVLLVREHGKRVRTQLAAFFNIPLVEICETKENFRDSLKPPHHMWGRR